MKISSLAFDHEGSIPAKYTCEGENISPPLVFEGVPIEAMSLVLVMDDPDVPIWVREDGNWDHWVVYNIDPHTKKVAEGEKKLGKNGRSTSGTLGYEGPCPPDREHRYFFRLFALDKILDAKEGLSKKELLATINGHVIAIAELMGRYEKKKK